MGLDATVRCTCWERGLCKPPPLPVVEDEYGWIEADVPEDEASAAFGKIEAWKLTCCPHRGMELHDEHIGNWFTVRTFYAAVAEMELPALMAEIPSGNGGTTTAKQARLCLDELQLFRELWRGRGVFLVDEDGEDLRSNLGLDDITFQWGGGLKIGFGAAGVCFRDQDSGELLFRSAHLRQELPALNGGNFTDGIATFTDIPSGESYRGSAAIAGHTIPWADGRMENDQGQCRFSYPESMSVEVREIGADFHAYALDALTRLFEASASSGGLIIWC